MYPFFRMAKELYVHRNDLPLDVGGIHVSHHMCWPWDLDLWMELNNGRTLTLFDLGRIPLARRTGLVDVIAKNKWGMTVAGVSVRYRQRIRLFRRVEMRSRALGWDARFMYVEQSMWNRRGQCTTHGLYRMAVTDESGIVAPAKVAAAMGIDETSPTLPDWVQAWITGDAKRPWPPDMA